MNLKLILFVGVCAIGFAISANAGTIADVDGDTIPDVFDDCSAVANGPATAGKPNQLDSDSPTDGYGNMCDGDLDNDGVVGGTDFGIFSGLFGGGDLRADFTGDGVIGGTDFGEFVGFFGGGPGPSGLNCAGTSPCP
jgi:hypothetical protein